MASRRLDEFSVIIGVLLAVFAQAGYDTLKIFYQFNYPALGPYFPSAWAGLVTGLTILVLFLIRQRWRDIFTGSGEGR